jgi:hypothetical protein
MANNGVDPGITWAARAGTLACILALMAACAPTYDQARAGPALRTIYISLPADRLLPCMDPLLVQYWAARAATIARAQTRNGRFGELVIADRDGPLLLVEVLTLEPYWSRIDMRTLRLRADEADLNRIATVAEACSS